MKGPTDDVRVLSSALRRAAIIYQHAARGADEAISDAMDAQVEAAQSDDKDGDDGTAGALVPLG